MSVVINPALREQLGLNISLSELKKLEKLDVKNIRNVDILRLKQTFRTSHNELKKCIIAKVLTKLAQPQVLVPEPRRQPRPDLQAQPQLLSQPPRPGVQAPLQPRELPPQQDLQAQPQLRVPQPRPRLQVKPRPDLQAQPLLLSQAPLQPRALPPRPDLQAQHQPRVQPPRPRLQPAPLPNDAQALQLKELCQVDGRQPRNMPPLHPENISQLIKGAKTGKYKKFEGTNREVFIDPKTGQGYKIFKLDSTWSALTDADLRVNDIYRDHRFYGGKYASFATNEIITMRDDRVKGAPQVKVFSFQKIPEAKSLGPNEKIPHSVLVMMEQAGFRPFDIKPDNFIKLANAHGGYDYLPIDAKLIGLKRSNSERSLEVQSFKERVGPYCYGQRCVDYKR